MDTVVMLSSFPVFDCEIAFVNAWQCSWLNHDNCKFHANKIHHFNRMKVVLWCVIKCLIHKLVNQLIEIGSLKMVCAPLFMYCSIYINYTCTNALFACSFSFFLVFLGTNIQAQERNSDVKNVYLHYIIVQLAEWVIRVTYHSSHNLKMIYWW